MSLSSISPAKPRRDAALAADPLFRAADKLKEAEGLRQSRNFQQAKRVCQELLREFPDYVGALHTLGLVLADLKDYEASISYLSKAVMLCPKDWRILTALSGSNLKLDRADTAITCLEQAEKLNPTDPTILGTLAEIYRTNKEYELAAKTFEAFREIDSAPSLASMSLADCYAQLGRLEDAAAVYEALIEEGRSGLAALSGLAQLPEALSGRDILATLEDLPGPLDTESDHYLFARAMGLHRAGRYAEAWEELLAANETKKRKLDQDWRAGAASRQASLDFARRIPTAERAADRAGIPISLFLLGPSRSGKTTLERLLGGLDGVKRGYENPIVENAVRRTMQVSGCITRSSINGMPTGLDPVFVDHYTEDLTVRAGDARVFTNTHPGKIVEVLRYARTVPGARFLFVKREPDDLAARIFMKNYKTGNAYAYELQTIREHVDWYTALIDLCAEKLPDISRVVAYEDMIRDPSSAVRAAAEVCGVEFKLDSLPALGDDHGIAAPYRDQIRQSRGT